MNQVKKFYFASFLKNQIYFVPIMVLFFQDIGLNYSQIFWIFTLGSVLSFLIEIPTGIFADIYGKRKSLLIAKFLIVFAFLSFGFSENFLMLLFSNLLYITGQSFRTGTEVGYIYDFLKLNPGLPSYTIIKNKQKIYARISEAIAAVAGGFIAVKFGFNMVFFVAAVPAFINYIITFSWLDFEKNSGEAKVSIGQGLKEGVILTKESLKEIQKNSLLLRLLMNIMIFSSVFFAIEKFIQPYMLDIGINLEYFGIIYSGLLVFTALVVKLSDSLEKKFGAINVSNYLSLLAFIPIVIIGLGFKSYVGIGFLFIILIIENVRSSIVTTIFHDMINSKNRSTMGSVLELFKSGGKLILLPISGYFADVFSIYTAILFLGIILLLNGLFFWTKETK